MHHILTILAFIAQLITTGIWPDGTPMDAWFSNIRHEVPATERKAFVITDFGAVPDSTLLQTEAIQKAIESYRITDEQKAYLKGLKRKQ